jgi:hypothetical protein
MNSNRNPKYFPGIKFSDAVLANDNEAAARPESAPPVKVTSAVQASQATSPPVFSGTKEPLSAHRPPTIDVLSMDGLASLRGTGIFYASAFGNLFVSILATLEASAMGYSTLASISGGILANFLLNQYFPHWLDPILGVKHDNE